MSIRDLRSTRLARRLGQTVLAAVLAGSFALVAAAAGGPDLTENVAVIDAVRVDPPTEIDEGAMVGDAVRVDRPTAIDEAATVGDAVRVDRPTAIDEAATVGDAVSVAPVWRPPFYEPWPTCAVRDTFCVQSLLINGVEQVNGAVWRVGADLLNGYTVRWYVERANASAPGGWGPPTAGVQVRFVLRTGDIWPLFGQLNATAYEQSVQSVAGGPPYTLTVNAKPVTLQWKEPSVEGGNCYGGECGGITTRADMTTTQLGGGSQNMGAWSPEEKALFQRMWTATDAQYQTLPQFSTYPTPRWWLSLGNPHLSATGTPVVGSYSAYVPKALLAAVGATDAQAAATGLNVTRTDGTAVTIVGAAVSVAGDGGVFLRIPQVGYSTAEYSVDGAGGTRLVLPPDPVPYLTAEPVPGGAVITLQAPQFDGGAPISSYRVACSAPGLDAGASAKAAGDVEVRGLVDGVTYTCRARADNAAGRGEWSYGVEVTTGQQADATLPGAPTSLTVSVRNTTVSARWLAPSSTGGSTIIGYQVTVVRSDSTKVIDATTKAAAGRWQLPPGSYALSVAARNAVGTGPAATASFTVE